MAMDNFVNVDVTPDGWYAILIALAVCLVVLGSAAIFTKGWIAFSLRQFIGGLSCLALIFLGFSGFSISENLSDIGMFSSDDNAKSTMLSTSGFIGAASSVAYAIAAVIFILMVCYTIRETVSWHRRKQAVNTVPDSEQSPFFKKAG